MVDTYHVFDAEVLRHVDFKPVAGLDQVLIPGDPGRKTRIQRTQNGIPLPDDTRAAIVNTAREVGVSEGSIQRATA
ncbi:LDH2 family malate/lactate/ureidoglycolate dehydrogenase [Bradyrhizobium diazoefficiens]|uniref:Bsr2972 protein n=2 Tax=Bradyrhizobium diazoefficiens TaxID=1355477 RepID=Q89R00_BRADU|nr:putative oxidoreductase [Bradyrhizobium japonicum]PDT63376.1 hypothetical protein CO678_03030 [Bradyrhizobium diazoefficiens]BAC48237.1 bsr2972 [Bradyrhizobium diazoefficiens USDA 110]QBP27077.1 hypothetical protein Bdiaspc4_15365 [Bradyrhizobium diazoefficiens]BAR60151.1 hypothetical protein NK6_7000 [Bradyrhizobium diazoefficiens]